MLTFSNTLLRKLSAKIDNGEPINALLWANEYLSPDEPLRKALAHKAIQFIGEHSDPTAKQAVLCVIAGKRLAELEPKLQRKISTLRETGVTVSRYLPTRAAVSPRTPRITRRSNNVRRRSSASFGLRIHSQRPF